MHQSPQRRSRTFCRWGMRATKQRRKVTTNQSFHLSLHQISHAAGPARRQIPHGSTYSLVLHRVQAWNRGHGGAHASAYAGRGRRWKRGAEVGQRGEERKERESMRSGHRGGLPAWDRSGGVSNRLRWASQNNDLFSFFASK